MVLSAHTETSGAREGGAKPLVEGEDYDRLATFCGCHRIGQGDRGLADTGAADQ